MTAPSFRQSLPLVLLFVVVTAAYALKNPPTSNDQADITVHEWGTFTSVAGEDGRAVSWRPFGGPTDLPCFVERFREFKGDLAGTVRMETPVLYFYASRESTADVKVLFPKNVITEWYPKAATSRVNDAIEWHDVRITPDVAPDFPVEPGHSHYYAARKTDAAPLQVGTQKERFLFYRGVGSFALPVSAKAMADGGVLVKNLGADAISDLILFENRGGNLRYRVAGTLQNEVSLKWDSAQSNLKNLEMDLEKILVAQGLYEKEALAMIATWRDSWFEEGTRLFYVVPRRAIDSVLPLDIQPPPSRIARIFVGRMEILTASVKEDVKHAIAASDSRTLEKYGRFLEPIAQQIGARSSLLDDVYSAYLVRASGCEIP